MTSVSLRKSREDDIKVILVLLFIFLKVSIYAYGYKDVDSGEKKLW